MKALKTFLILGLTFLVLGVCGLELKKNVDFSPKIELVPPKSWSLTEQQMQQFEKLNQGFAADVSAKTFVTKITNIFNSLSELSFISDARWAWDHQEPLKIKAYVAQPKAMMFKKNEWYLISDKGAILKKVSADQTLDLPIFTAESLVLDDKKRAQSFKILQAFESSTSRIPITAVSEVSTDARGIFVLLSEGYKVYVSDNNPTLQIDRVSNVLAYLKREKINVEFIDARSVQKILVRPKTKSKN